MREKPVGIFDSGLGGLTVVKAMKSILPHENTVYFGDTKRVPYGNKDKDTIIKYARQDIAFLKSMDVKIVIAACGTVSSYLKELEFGPYIIGVTKPTCAAAVNITKNGKIGVMGTTAAVNSRSYESCITDLNPNIIIYQQECPLLVPLIEQGFITDSGEELRKAVKMYTKRFIDKNVDTLILGCTHYPIIKNVIQKMAGKEVTLIDSGKETARYVKKILEGQELNSQKKTSGKQKFFVSSEIQNFSRIGKMFLGYDIHENIESININSY